MKLPLCNGCQYFSHLNIYRYKPSRTKYYEANITKEISQNNKLNNTVNFIQEIKLNTNI